MSREAPRANSMLSCSLGVGACGEATQRASPRRALPCGGLHDTPFPCRTAPLPKCSKQEVMNLLESAGFSRSNPYYIVQQGKVGAGPGPARSQSAVERAWHVPLPCRGCWLNGTCGTPLTRS